MSDIQTDSTPGLFNVQPLRSLLGFPIDKSGSPLPSAETSNGLLADGLRAMCRKRCTDLVLLAPGGRRPFTWDQCLAHCQGTSRFERVQPLIPFPSQ